MKRRDFLAHSIKTGAGIFLASQLSPASLFGKTVNPGRKLGVALVGLGRYSAGQLGPALLETNSCYLAGIVTGTPEKEKQWADKYHIESKNIYNYKNFDDIANNPDIDIVYVVLPNNMHAEYVIRAAEAGKHVITEKPMANSVTDCQKMIDACRKANKKLSVGYRLYFEPFTRNMMRLGQKKVYGDLKKISGGFSFVMKNPKEWRINKLMAGGGPLVDLGIYCIQGMIYTSGELPITVTAKDSTKNKDFFKEVEGSIEWEFTFPSGLKSYCITSYEQSHNFLKAEAEKGTFEMMPAYSYHGNKGITPQGPMDFPDVNQQALQMDAFAQCVLNDEQTIVPGEMGMRDVYLIEKIYEAAATGKEVSLDKIPDILYKI